MVNGSSAFTNDDARSARGVVTFRAKISPMSIDVVDLRNFYAQRLGVAARRFVGRGIRLRFGDPRGLRVLGLGYATPYLGLFREEAERCLAFMPAVQGVVKWPSAQPGRPGRGEELDPPPPD